MVFFGKYKGTFYETGYWWVNPFMSAKQISIRARNLNVDPIKVNDKTGNPILIGLVLVWKIKRDDIYKAVFEIDAPTTAGQTGVSASARMNILENFVGVQSDAALRQVAGCYSYDNNGVADDELTLRSNSEQINDQLEHTLNERLAMAGIEVVEARINYLAYAPEIASRPMPSSPPARRSSRVPCRWCTWRSTASATSISSNWTKSARRPWCRICS